MLETVKTWLGEHQTLVWWLATGSIITLIVSVVVVPLMVSRMRYDYFVHEAEENPKSLKNTRPALYFTALVLKNVFGGILVIFGLLLSVPLVPGQGVLTMLVGFLVMDFPGKKRIELFIIKLKPVMKTVRWMRQKAGRQELELP